MFIIIVYESALFIYPVRQWTIINTSSACLIAGPTRQSLASTARQPEATGSRASRLSVLGAPRRGRTRTVGGSGSKAQRGVRASEANPAKRKPVPGKRGNEKSNPHATRVRDASTSTRSPVSRSSRPQLSLSLSRSRAMSCRGGRAC